MSHHGRRTHSFPAEVLKKLMAEKGTICCNCQQDCGSEIMFHHIVPVSIGGQDIFSNIVPLCETCHKKLHGISNEKGVLSHSALIKAGIQKSRTDGVQIGRPRVTSSDVNDNVRKYIEMVHNNKISIMRAAQELHISRNSFYKYMALIDNETAS